MTSAEAPSRCDLSPDVDFLLVRRCGGAATSCLLAPRTRRQLLRPPAPYFCRSLIGCAGQGLAGAAELSPAFETKNITQGTPPPLRLDWG